MKLNRTNVERVKQLVKEIDLPAEFIYHEESGKTTDQAVSALGIEANSILKTLILYASKEDQFFGAIILGDSRLDIKKMTKLSNVKKLRFANEDQIYKLTGFLIGGVPPLAIKFCKKSFLDKAILENKSVVGAGGDEYCGIIFNPKDFIKKVTVCIEDLIT